MLVWERRLQVMWECRQTKPSRSRSFNYRRFRPQEKRTACAEVSSA
ncbi:MAG: hypothetical protein F6K07_14230 [Okeania sp. SIO1H5]|nr:hypothetical protein [Okeania sp. SIO1H5]